MIEQSKKATIIILIVVFATIIGIPVLAYNMKFEVDEGSVWFSREGNPHCPYCFRIVSYDEPHVGYCSRCERSFRWMDKQVVCWHCGGQKLCQVCKGTRSYPRWYLKGDEECYNCMGTGKCPFCLEGKLEGYNIFGNASVRHPAQRP